MISSFFGVAAPTDCLDPARLSFKFEGSGWCVCSCLFASSRCGAALARPIGGGGIKIGFCIGPISDGE